MAVTEKIMLDFDSTVFRLLDAMQLCPGGERVRYEDCPSWGYLMHLCGPEGDHSDDERLAFMLDLFNEAMQLQRMHQLGPDGVYEGCRDALTALRDRGVEIHVVTDRPAELIDDTAQFLRDHDIPFDTIHRVSGRDKTQWCLDNGVHVMIDDHPDTLAQAHEAGLSTLTLRHLYNDHLTGPVFADTWAELAPLIDDAIRANYGATSELAAMRRGCARLRRDIDASDMPEDGKAHAKRFLAALDHQIAGQTALMGELMRD